MASKQRLCNNQLKIEAQNYLQGQQYELKGCETVRRHTIESGRLGSEDIPGKVHTNVIRRCPDHDTVLPGPCYLTLLRRSNQRSGRLSVTNTDGLRFTPTQASFASVHPDPQLQSTSAASVATSAQSFSPRWGQPAGVSPCQTEQTNPRKSSIICCWCSWLPSTLTVGTSTICGRAASVMSR